MKITNFFIAGLIFMATPFNPYAFGLQQAGTSGYDAGSNGYALDTGNGYTPIPVGALRGQYAGSSAVQGVNTGDGYSTTNNSGALLDTQQAAALAQQKGAALANYNQQISQADSGLGRLDPQLNVGLGNIGNSYNQSQNRLNEDHGLAQRSYDQSVQQNTQGYLNNRNAVQTNTRAQASALQRLLGMNGSGNSSAAYEQAPYAAALQGSQALNGAQQTFGNNTNLLTTNWDTTNRNYKHSQEDLQNQRFQQENALRSSIAQTRAGLLDQRASALTNRDLANGVNYQQAINNQAGSRNQINSLLDSITQLGNQYQNPVLKTGPVNFAAPQLNDYTLGRGAAVQQTQGGAAADINPAFLGLLAQERDPFGNPITA